MSKQATRYLPLGSDYFPINSLRMSHQNSLVELVNMFSMANRI